jgi:hypothetical protein
VKGFGWRRKTEVKFYLLETISIELARSEATAPAYVA